MSNPVTAAILQDKVESPQPIRSSSILIWNHWRVTLPEPGKAVVVTDEKSLLVAKRTEGMMWDTGLFVLPINNYPLWSEQPAFSKTARKTSGTSKDVLATAGTM